ncbi:MAG TPA: outer membrane beta-barrel protein, partial [Flavobacterium sp.]|nr:outer membrane beta-barrel protein [Flavobacterium sp.]
MKNLLCLCAFLCTSFLFAQKIELKGKVIASDKKPIEAATVYLSAQKDSTLIDYTITDTSGNFTMPLKSIDAPSFVTVSHIGFEDFSKKLEHIKQTNDLGIITLNPESDLLDELVITTDGPPIRVKKDTLEFNASAFKVRPDATVKELLEQLPGVEVDDEGKIKVNGKEVSNVLVNGKPFFSEDGKVIMENLPANIINKVQVTDYKSKEEKLTGATTNGETKTINLTIDEDKNKGLFGKFIAGYGSDDHYESSMLFNYFKNDLKVSVLGSSNNINSQGFSTNEIMDNMSGGRNSYSSRSSDGSFSINGLEFGGGKGIYQTDMIGLNYSDNWGKKNKVNMNYLFNEVENNNKNKSRVENLLPDNRYVTDSESELKSKSANHTFNYNIEMELDSLTTLSISPNLKRGISSSKTNSFSETRNEFGELLNESDSKNFLNVDTYSFTNQFLVARRFKRKGRSLSFTFNNKNTKNDTEQTKNSAAYFYQTQMPDDIRNQTIGTTTHTDEYTMNVVYREPISPKQTLQFNFTQTWTNEFQGRNTFDFNQTANQYSDYNNLLSFSNSLKGSKTAPLVGYFYNGEKLYLSFSGGTTLNNYNVSSFYNSQSYLNQRLDVLPNIRSYARLQLGKSSSIYGNYSYSEESPMMMQLLEYEDLSSSLATIKGNKDLQTQQKHNVYLGFNNYDWQSRSGYYFYSSMTYSQRGIGMINSYDENYFSNSSYINVNDTYNFWAGINYSKSFKLTDKDKLTVAAGLDFNSNKDRGILNDVAYSSNSTDIGPSIDVTFDFDKKIILKPSYSYELTNRSFENLPVAKTKYFKHNVGFMVTSYLPKNVVFGSDIMYTYNSNIADGFKKDYLLWNMSLGYNFLNERFLAKVKVYDILNQNQSVTRMTTPTSIYDTQDTILKQYVMFSLTYKLEKF